jgi:hypothetical protein
MKSIKKFVINPEKVIKNDELVKLRGGYGSPPCTCTCFDANKFVETGEVICLGYVYTETNCPAECAELYGAGASGECGNINCDNV